MLIGLLGKNAILIIEVETSYRFDPGRRHWLSLTGFSGKALLFCGVPLCITAAATANTDWKAVGGAGSHLLCLTAISVVTERQKSPDSSIFGAKLQGLYQFLRFALDAKKLLEYNKHR